MMDTGTQTCYQCQAVVFDTINDGPPDCTSARTINKPFKVNLISDLSLYHLENSKAQISALTKNTTMKLELHVCSSAGNSEFQFHKRCLNRVRDLSFGNLEVVGRISHCDGHCWTLQGITLSYASPSGRDYFALYFGSMFHIQYLSWFEQQRVVDYAVHRLRNAGEGV